MCRQLCFSAVAVVVSVVLWGVVHVYSGPSFEISITREQSPRLLFSERESTVPGVGNGNVFRVRSGTGVLVAGHDALNLCARGELGKGSRLFVDGVEQDCTGTQW